MFTGIITHIGKVERIEKSGDWRLRIAVTDFTRAIAIGASVSCSGVCLTVIEKDKDSFTVQASRETLSRTTLGTWKKGTRVNLERALKVGDELGGHFVSGHVDGLARLEEVETSGESKIMQFSCHSNLCEITKLGKQTGNPSPHRGEARRGANDAKTKPVSPHPNPPPREEGTHLIRFIAPKGSVTLDGVSLTVNEVKGDFFTVNIIPHTLKETTLNERKKGDKLNLEIDLIARYLARWKEG